MEACLSFGPAGRPTFRRPSVVFGPEGVDWIALEVWRDCGLAVCIEGALLVRAQSDGAPIERC
jgi:hypothetical protein